MAGPAPSPVGGVGQHASPSRRRSPVRTRYGYEHRWRGPPGPDRRRARRRGGTQTRRTQNPVPQGVGVQVPPSAQRLPPRRAPGPCTAGSGGRHPGEALAEERPQAEVMERRHASLRSWCPPGRASASLAFRTRLSGHNFTRLLRRRVPAARTGGGGGRHPEEALVARRPSTRKWWNGRHARSRAWCPQRVCGSESRLPHAGNTSGRGSAWWSAGFGCRRSGVRLSPSRPSGSGAAWQRRVAGGHEVVGSIPACPTDGEWCNRQHVRL